MDQNLAVPQRTRQIWVWQDDARREAPLHGFVVEWRRHIYRWWANVLTAKQDAEGWPHGGLSWLEAHRTTAVRSDPNGGRVRYLS